MAQEGFHKDRSTDDNNGQNPPGGDHLVENEYGEACCDNRLQIEKIAPPGLVRYGGQSPDPEELGNGGVPDAEAQQC